jgi:hypothetical protein
VLKDLCAERSLLNSAELLRAAKIPDVRRNEETFAESEQIPKDVKYLLMK